MAFVIGDMINRMKQHPEYGKMGMIASHLGVVRAFSLNGKKVVQMEVEYDKDVIDKIINDAKLLPGIIDVLVEHNSGRLNVGEEVMAVVIGGDVRENVFPALTSVVNKIKEQAVRKKEIYEE